jgi:hypothetical protein
MTSGPTGRVPRSPTEEGDSLGFRKSRRQQQRHAYRQRILLSSLDLHIAGIVGEMEIALPGFDACGR